MGALCLMIVTFLGYLLMYKLYGRFLGKKIFELSATNIVPSVAQNDGIDFVPTEKEVIFGHHFTSIAGTGPIVGPAIGIIWGWIPAMIWIFFGSIFMGAVHDLGTLVISLRNEGKSLSEYTAKYISTRTKMIFFAIIFLELWLVIAIFGLVIAVIFKMYPAAVFPVWFEIPIAVTVGILIYKKGWKPLFTGIAAMIIMYITVALGYFWQFEMPEIFGIPATGIWTIILLIYAYIASILPVTALLQPRDYINSHQLIVAMILLVAGVIAAAFTRDLTIVAPAISLSPKDAPSMFPFLFITIACGAISGFHSLVSSGTSSKQVKCEHDALFVGYGSMLLEGALATLVVIAVAAGIGLSHNGLTGVEAWNSQYSSWSTTQGLGAQITAFVIGSANMISALKIPEYIAITVMGVFVASFASTTLDTATRIQRYVVTEIFTGLQLKFLTGKHVCTSIVVISAALLAFITGADGKGALKLWPLFGAINQALAALALLVVSLYLKQQGKYKYLVTLIPAIIMTAITIYATILNQITFINSGFYLLAVINSIILVIVIWITIEATITFYKK